MHRNGWTMRCGNRAKKQICVVFRLSLSHDLPPHHLPQGTGFSDNKPLVLLPFCPQRTFSVSCTWWFILDVRFPRLLLSKISRYSRADQRDHPADASTASFSQILWSRGICRLGMPRQCGRAFVELWWKRLFFGIIAAFTTFNWWYHGMVTQKCGIVSVVDEDQSEAELRNIKSNEIKVMHREMNWRCGNTFKMFQKEEHLSVDRCTPSKCKTLYNINWREHSQNLK